MSVWQLLMELSPALAFALADALVAIGMAPALPLGRWGPLADTWTGRVAYAVVTGCSVICLTAPVYAVVWLGRYWSGKLRPLRFVTLRVIPLILAGCLVTLVLLLETAKAATLEHRNTTTVTIWLMSLLLPLFTLAGLVIWIGQGRQAGRWLKWHTLAVSLAGLVICIYLGYWGLLGLQTWRQ